MSEFFKDKKFMQVSPIHSMHVILAKTIPKDQMFINYGASNYGFPMSPDDFSNKETSEEVISGWFKNPTRWASPDTLKDPGQDYSEAGHIIRLKALVDLYKK